MKSSLEETEEIISTTSTVREISDFPSKENSFLFNKIDKLAADHDVTVSNTMIKVTYKKPLKDHYSPFYVNGIEPSKNFVLIENNMNSSLKKPELCEKKNKIKPSLNSSNTNIIIVPNSKDSFDPSKQDSDNLVSFSSDNQSDEAQEERKKEHFNGLNLVKIKEPKVKNIGDVDISQFATNSHSHGNILNLQKSKPKISQKESFDEKKFHSNNVVFLKRISLVKVKNSISKNSLLEKKPDSEKTPQNLQKTPVKSDNKTKELEVVIKKIKPPENTISKKIRKIEVSSKAIKRKLVDGKCKPEIKSKRIDDKKDSGDKKPNKNVKAEESNNKKPIMLVDPDLPSGWKRYIRTRNKGLPDEKHIVYVVSPQGKKFRFKWKLRRYLEKTNSTLDADQFFFGLYKRSRPFNVPIVENKGDSKILSTGENSEDFSDRKEKSSTISSSKSTSAETLEGEMGNSQRTDVAEARELLYYDPDLPFGWKRTINSNNSRGRLQVNIISPEGRIFRRRYRLSEYLAKHQYTHSLDRFYFGLYPKKYSTGNTNGSTESSSKNSVDFQLDQDDSGSNEPLDEDKFLPKDKDGNPPMYNDPSLPKGWRRFIKVRSCGESAGRMEVVIVSPDNRRHRSKGQLEQYLLQNNLNYHIDDFDFSVYGKKRPVEPEPESELENTILKKRFKSLLNIKPVPDFDIDSLKEVKLTPVGEMINAVNSLMINCELSSVRSQRRSCLPRSDHEKVLKNYLNSEQEESNDDYAVPTNWIQKLVKCRSDFRALEKDAASTIAEKTEEFLKELARRAFQSSQQPSEGLQYEDLANIVDEWECLLPLRNLIPKKITYKEFIKLNRPKKFLSFT